MLATAIKASNCGLNKLMRIIIAVKQIVYNTWTTSTNSEYGFKALSTVSNRRGSLIAWAIAPDRKDLNDGLADLLIKRHALLCSSKNPSISIDRIRSLIIISSFLS
jgi:hypothetical protein